MVLGYRWSVPRLVLTIVATLLTFPLLALAFFWRHDWFVRFSCNRTTLRDASVVLIQVYSYSRLDYCVCRHRRTSNDHVSKLTWNRIDSRAQWWRWFERVQSIQMLRRFKSFSSRYSSAWERFVKFKYWKANIHVCFVICYSFNTRAINFM